MPKSETQNQEVNKVIEFTAKNEGQLTVTVTIKHSHFYSMKIEFYSSKTYATGYSSGHYRIIKSTDELIVEYESNFAVEEIPKYQQVKFKFKEYNTKKPVAWEEEYLNNEEFRDKLLNNEITIDEAKSMILDLIYVYEPDEVNTPDEAFIDELFRHAKRILNSDEYRFELQIRDL